MHSLSEFGSNVPAFLAKLWKLVDDPDTNDLISWSEEGTSFLIRDQAQFSRKLLPMYYKHNNMASFIRQLNMYGFHKIVSADAGSLRLEKDEMEFAHQCFLRGHSYLLEHIKRKVGKSQILSNKVLEDNRDGSTGGVMVKAEFLSKVLSEVKGMRGRQDSVDGRLTAMKQENEALWRELSLLRQKHMKQQTIVNQLIKFFVTLVHHPQRLSPKRRYPLMINSVAHPNGKANGKVSNINLNINDNLLSRSPCGTIIHELDGESVLPDTDADLLSDTIPINVPVTEPSSIVDSDLEPDVLSSDAGVLDSFGPTDIVDVPLLTDSSTLSRLEVNSSEPVVLDADILNMDSPSPESLLAVSPRDLNPAVVVPALRVTKVEPPQPNGRTAKAPAAQAAPVTARPQSTQRKGGAASKVEPGRVSATQPAASTTSVRGAAASSSSSISSAAATSSYAVPQGKKELRVLPPRNRRKRHSNSKDNTSTTISELRDPEDPLDLLAEVGLTNADQQDPIATDGPADAAMLHEPGRPTPSPLVVFPHSPGASPSTPTHGYSGSSVAMSSMSGMSNSDVTSPLVVFPMSEPRGTTRVMPTPQLSPISSSPSPHVSDLTLACTSQGASSATSTTAAKQQFNRSDSTDIPLQDYDGELHNICRQMSESWNPKAESPASPKSEDLDLHVGALENELSQLKDLFHTSGIQLDANTLLGLFTGDDSTSYNMPMADSGLLNHSSKNENSGNELMYYQPDLMDLNDLWNEYSRSTPPPSPSDTQSELNTPIMTPVGAGSMQSASKRRKV